MSTGFCNDGSAKGLLPDTKVYSFLRYLQSADLRYEFEVKCP